MNKSWLTIEKIVAILIAVWGIIALYSVTAMVANLIRNGYATAKHLTVFQLIMNNHLNFLLAVASLFGGCMLLFNDKRGWLFSFICSVLYTVTFFISSRANAKDPAQPYYQFFKSYSLMALLFLVIAIVLIQKPFWKKYQLSTKNSVLLIAIIAILIVDKLVF